MSIKLNVEEKAIETKDVFLVSVDDIIVKPELRGRWHAPEPKQIIERAVSMLGQGQMQPVECRRVTAKNEETGKDEKNKLELVYGFTRYEAAKLIIEGFKDQGGNFHQNKDFKLMVRVVDSDEKTAFLRNVSENNQRNATSPIDDAVNQQKLRELYGWKDADIARFYGYKVQNKVGQLRKLLELGDKEKRMVHSGELSIQAAIDLLALEEGKRGEALEAAKKKNGKVSGTELKKAVRDQEIAKTETKIDDSAFSSEDGGGGQRSEGKAEPAPSKPDLVRARTIKELREFFKGQVEKREDGKAKKLCETILGFIGGSKTEKAMENKIKDIDA